MAYRLNHLHQRGKEFPVKRIQLDLGDKNGGIEFRGNGCGRKLKAFTRQVRQVSTNDIMTSYMFVHTGPIMRISANEDHMYLLVEETSVVALLTCVCV